VEREEHKGGEPRGMETYKGKRGGKSRNYVESGGALPFVRKRKTAMLDGPGREGFVSCHGGIERKKEVTGRHPPPLFQGVRER